MYLKLMSLLFTIILSACTNDSIPKATVMITNLPGNSGGSGTIVSSDRHESLILTNSHVCDLARGGAVVHTHKQGDQLVVSYKQSMVHDLCLITVYGNLHIDTDVARNAPRLYSPVKVSGHPHLMPNIISEGHLSSNMIVTIMTKITRCTPKEAADPTMRMFCRLLGGIPTLRTYEGTAISATIQPGSSGSAVYNEDKEIIAVVFAGQEDFGYGVAVPYQYVRNFLEVEIDGLPPQYPNRNLISPTSEGRISTSKVREVCDKAKTNKQREFCDSLLDSINASLLTE